MEQHPLFSSRDSLDEAVAYGTSLINAPDAVLSRPSRAQDRE